MQSVALRLIVDREREIEAFVPEEYWNCGAALAATKGTGHPFVGRLVPASGEKLAVKSGTEAAKVRADLEMRASRWRRSPRASASETRPRPTRRASSSRTRSIVSGSAPSAPCKSPRGSTRASTSEKDGGPVGLITYMRTDSTRLSPDAVKAAREHVGNSTAGVGARPAQRLQVEEELPRRARSDPAHVDGATPEQRAPTPEGRAIQALQTDLGALRRLPDVPCSLRSDEHRHRGEVANDQDVVRAARQRPGPPVRRLARSVRQGRADSRHGRRSRAKATTTRARASARRRNFSPTTATPPSPISRSGRSSSSSCRPASSPSRSSPSRPRATRRRRSCASSKSEASAGRAPTRRSSARCRRATTSRRWTGLASVRRSSASSSSTVWSGANSTSWTPASPRKWRRSSTKSKRARKSGSTS